MTEPFEKRPADWREHYGLWLASERYLEQTGLFKIDHAGGRVNRKEKQNHDSRDNAQQAGVVFKAMREVVRKRQSVVCGFGIDAKRSGNDEPVGQRAECQTDGDRSC